MDESVTIPNIKLCEKYYCKMETRLACKYESKLKWYDVERMKTRKWSSPQSSKKPVRKPAT